MFSISSHWHVLYKLRPTNVPVVGDWPKFDAALHLRPWP